MGRKKWMSSEIGVTIHNQNESSSDFELGRTIQSKRIKKINMKKNLRVKILLKTISMVNGCWDLLFIKLYWKYKFSSKPIFYLVLNQNLIYIQIRWFNLKDQFKLHI